MGTEETGQEILEASRQPGAGGDGELVSDDAREREEAAERLARLRQAAARLDSHPRGIAAARRLRRALPGDSRFGDPLSTAGRAPVEVIARGVSTLRPESDSFVKELGLAGLQIWQSLSEAAGRGRGDIDMAVVFTDLVGFSSWALKAGDAAALELLRAVGAASESAVLARDGRIVKRLGDGLMATFLSADDAVQAALEAQDAVKEIEIDGYSPKMRVGVHWGRPRKLGGDYLGVDVNVAARVAEAAKGDEVLVSGAALGQIDAGGLKLGRAKRLRAEGAPRDLQVVKVSRA